MILHGKPVQYHININARQFSFQMDHDPEFTADCALRNYFLQGSVPEREVFSVMFNALKPGDTAFDIGANVGLFSLFMAQLVAPGGKVLSFEPSRVNYDKLRRNMKLNKADVWIHPWALSDKLEEEGDFYEAADTGQSAMAPLHYGMEASYKVKVGLLDGLSEEYTPKLIKIDCEGSEANILKGGEQMLKRGVPFVLCEIADQNLRRFNTDQFGVRDYMRWLGYDCWLPNPTGDLPLYIPYATTFCSEILNLNVLFASEKTVTSTWQRYDVKGG